MRQCTFYPHQDYEKVNFYKKSSLYLIGWSVRNCKITACLQLAKIGKNQPKLDKIYFFYQQSQLLYDVMQKEIENLEFVRGVNFELIDSLKNNGTKYLTTPLKRFANQKPLLTLPALGDIGVWAQSTLNTTFFTRANQEDTLSYNIVLFKSPVT